MEINTENWIELQAEQELKLELETRKQIGTKTKAWL